MKKSGSCGDVKAAKVIGAAEAVLGIDAKGQNSMYDTRSGTLLTIVLLFVIGWIPTIGQMVAGYVGGRRAGSPMRGLISSVLGTLIVISALFFTLFALSAIDAALVSNPESRIAEIAASSPVLEQLLNTFLSYARRIFGSADLTVNFAMYAVTIPFGIIGGILANQSQKEARLLLERSSKIHTRKARSLSLYRSGKPMGFESYDRYVKIGVNTSAVPPVKERETPVTVAAPAQESEPKVASTVRASPTEATSTVSMSVGHTTERTSERASEEGSADTMDYI